MGCNPNNKSMRKVLYGSKTHALLNPRKQNDSRTKGTNKQNEKRLCNRKILKQ